LNQLLTKILKHEGVATITTNGSDGAYVTATWNSYITINEDGNLLIPAGGYHQTEENSKAENKVIILIGSKEVMGKQGLGAGLRLTGIATFQDSGIHFEETSKQFPWIRAVMVFTIKQEEQLQ
jgi:Pyridoxamine 5'-phosphate oxidase